ncbi:UvrD-helicase domain-containing protein [Paracoccus litorisediminis]|uniref:UvrD-helicase domain-containing protein n=1 Tax=Paracoccus litorisediminis TaxID=2006130 RepID=UPI003733F2DA
MKPTDEQAAIYDAAAPLSQGDILKIMAFAGAGKTTTLKGIAKIKKQRGVYLVFNAQNAEEAKRKLALTNCTASTTHALALSAVRHAIGRPTSHTARTVVDSGIMDRFNIPRVEGWNDYRVAQAVLRTMSAFCNSAATEFNVSHGAESLISSVGDPDFIRDRVKKQIARDTIDRLADVLSKMAEEFWKNMASGGSFSHDMYLKVIDLDPNLRGQAFGMFRYLMVDEAQDLNPVQRSIILKTGLPVIAVGDPFQQIYSWRGAENALAKMEGQELYLTQSFRFGEQIAETARQILSMRPDGGPKQRLIGAGSGDTSGHEGAKVAIICRTNSGVIDTALELVRKGKIPHVDNMEGLIKDVRSAQALSEGRLRDVSSSELKHFNSWGEMQSEAEEGDGNLARLVSIVEDGLTQQIELLSTKQVKDPAKAQYAICTAHRSKGMEWPAVVLGKDWKDRRQMMGRFLKAKKQSEKHQTLAVEEFNALYVAATRPIYRLEGHDRVINPPEPEYDEGGYDPRGAEGDRHWQPEIEGDPNAWRRDMMSGVRSLKRDDLEDGVENHF